MIYLESNKITQYTIRLHYYLKIDVCLGAEQLVFTCGDYFKGQGLLLFTYIRYIRKKTRCGCRYGLVALDNHQPTGTAILFWA